MTVSRALKALSEFQGESLTASLAEIEQTIIGLGPKELQSYTVAERALMPHS